jgi:hypothetical protein
MASSMGNGLFGTKTGRRIRREAIVMVRGVGNGLIAMRTGRRKQS